MSRGQVAVRRDRFTNGPGVGAVDLRVSNVSDAPGRGDGVWVDEECMLGSDRRDMNAQSPRGVRFLGCVIIDLLNETN